MSFVRKFLESEGHRCQVLNTGQQRKQKSFDYLDVQNGLDYLTKVIWHAREGYLIHTHLNGDSIKGLILVLIAELVSVVVGKGCVLTFHAGPEQRFFPITRSRLMMPFYRLAFALASKIICNSFSVKEKIETYGVLSDKIIPIPAFSGQYLAYTEVKLSRDLQVFMECHEPILVSYFFLRPEFYVESLMRALGQLSETLPNIGFVLIGADSRLASVTEMIQTAGIRTNVYQAGDLSHDRFMTLISKVHLYVRTPKKDGVCSSVLEALSLKVPVIGSDNGSRPAGVITFLPDDAEDLTQKVLDVWERYDAIRAQLVPPLVNDTVEEEAKLLLTLAT